MIQEMLGADDTKLGADDTKLGADDTRRLYENPLFSIVYIEINQMDTLIDTSLDTEHTQRQCVQERIQNPKTKTF